MVGRVGWAGGAGVTLRLRGERAVDSPSAFGFGVGDEVDDFGMVDQFNNLTGTFQTMPVCKYYDLVLNREVPVKWRRAYFLLPSSCSISLMTRAR